MTAAERKKVCVYNGHGINTIKNLGYSFVRNICTNYMGVYKYNTKEEISKKKVQNTEDKFTSHYEDIFRVFAEILGNTGCIVIDGESETGVVIPNIFFHGEHIQFCKDDLSDLTDLTDYYLLHEDETKEMSASAHTFLMNYHTNIQRAEYFLEIVSRK